MRTFCKMTVLFFLCLAMAYCVFSLVQPLLSQVSIADGKQAIHSLTEVWSRAGYSLASLPMLAMIPHLDASALIEIPKGFTANVLDGVPAEIRLVKEAVAERNRLLRCAPHYVRPLETSIPIDSWF